jgi:hypothetical protein
LAEESLRMIACGGKFLTESPQVEFRQSWSNFGYDELNSSQ